MVLERPVVLTAPGAGRSLEKSNRSILAEAETLRLPVSRLAFRGCDSPSHSRAWDLRQYSGVASSDVFLTLGVPKLVQKTPMRELFLWSNL